MAIELAQSSSTTVLSPPRSYDVARFIGNPSRAKDLLGWTPQIGIRDGLERLIQDFQQVAEMRRGVPHENSESYPRLPDALQRRV